MTARFPSMLAVASVDRILYDNGRGLGPVKKRAGLCYEWAMRVIVLPHTAELDVLFIMQVMVHTGHSRIELVHGFPRRSVEHIKAGVSDGLPAGCRYGHAWVELHDSPCLEPLVYDAVTMTLMGRSAYYESGQIEPELCHRYSEDEAHERVMATETPGPWETYGGTERAYWTDDDDLPTHTPRCAQEGP